MTPEEYAAQQSLIAAGILQYAGTFGKYFQRPSLSLKEWLGLLALLFPAIQHSRDRSAELARSFYDEQRSKYHPELPEHKRDLEGTDFPTFVANMEPARTRMQQADSTDHAVSQLKLQAVREVENAGRRQIIHGVEDEPQEGMLRGWARVATGRETCAWCLMLVSRGPVYQTAESAGLNVGEQEAQAMDAAGTDVSGEMNKWHAGCDCIVVPVYKKVGWPGQQAQKKALDLWKEATLTAHAEARTDPDRTHDAGKNKGDPFTLNERAINALRRSLNNGSISTSSYAGIHEVAA